MSVVSWSDYQPNGQLTQFEPNLGAPAEARGWIYYTHNRNAERMTDHWRWRKAKIVCCLAAFCILAVIDDIWSVVFSQPLQMETRTSRQAEPINRQVLTLLVPLSGELGNHLHWISTAYRIKWHLESVLPVEIQIVGEHQNHKKWKHAQQDILNCFVNLKSFEFSAGRHSAEFRTIREKQRYFLQRHPGEFSITESGGDCRGLFECAERRAELAIKRWAETMESDPGNSTELHVEGSNYSLPFLMLREMDGPSINHEEEPIRTLFQINTTNPFCCSSLPRLDELVFHIRNFGVESNGRLPLRDVSFQELEPHQISLFISKAIESASPKDSVAILSRFPEAERTVKCKVALSERYSTRIIQGQTGIQDFCFMLHADNELFGSLTSTFVWWAAELGKMPATLYSMAKRNDTTFTEFVTSLDPHRWKESKSGSRIRHVPNIPVN